MDKYSKKLVKCVLDHMNMYSNQFIIISGTMFSGKSSALIYLMNEYKYIPDDHKILIRYHNDNRGNSISRDPRYKLNPGIKTIVTPSLIKFYESLPNSEEYLVGIDEAQFQLDSSIDELLPLLTKNRTTIMSGIVSDAESLSTLSSYIPYCDQIIKLQYTCSLCKTRQSSVYHKYLGLDTGDVHINDNYQVLCNKCYNITRS